MRTPAPELQRCAGARSRNSGRLFTLKDLNVVCWMVFAAFLVAPVGMLVKGKIQSGQMMHEEKDFVFFYSMGRMLNQYPASQLYDFGLQKKVETDVFPLKAGREYTPNPYAPFIGVLFRPFALIPYPVAYPLWIAFSFGLYVAGLAITTGQFFRGDSLRRSLVFCFALSFVPFLWIMVGGQISSIGFISFALAFREEDRGRRFRSGLGLALCLYKPTLLLLIVPMLLVSRRYRTVLGLATGGAALAVFTTAVEGIGVWSGYLRMLLSFGSAAANAHGYRVLRYYMDLFAFSSLLPGGRSVLGGAIILGYACLAGFALVWAWWKYRDAAKPASTLLWSATLTWTFLLNMYAPIYDSIILVVGTIATAAALRNLPDQRLRRQFTILWTLILAASWVTVPLAEARGIQLFTVLFALLGTLQLMALRRIAAPVVVGNYSPNLPDMIEATG